MIPRANIVAWQALVRWGEASQVEQDLVLSRAIVELFSDAGAREQLAFRGGTALHKLHLAPAARYSEDIDLVQVEAGPAKMVFDLVWSRLDPWLGKPKTTTKRNGVQLFYAFETEFPPVRTMRVKVEVNTREHFSELGFVTMPFAVESPWFSGTAEVTTYSLDEMLGTKLRALYQRRKGRDVFDLWHAFQRGSVDAATVVRCFRAYLGRTGLAVSRVEFTTNLDEKAGDKDFRGDIGPLLDPGLTFDHDDAFALVRERLVALL
ncbi:MAG: nucleotidyl transferase AbiEii/AbiGii toxin family protein [Deltaproteobacteria bacterium]|nr:nucleotidyl transferase AbiEii/AbiGii toxin family protein [Deltaproteobacteria bacterium]